MVDLENPFDAFYAVVLDHVHGGPLRWSPGHQAWLRLGPDGTMWANEPVDGDEVDAGQLETALGLIPDFLDTGDCRRCRREPQAEAHFIALNVLDQPTIHCVQQPAHDVVGSAGGMGVKKHVGGVHGCSAVKPGISRMMITDIDRIAVVAAHVYGEPLLADEVLFRTWCSRCATIAQRVAERSESPVEVTADERRDLDRRQHRYRVDEMVRVLAQQLGSITPESR